MGSYGSLVEGPWYFCALEYVKSQKLWSSYIRQQGGSGLNLGRTWYWKRSIGSQCQRRFFPWLLGKVTLAFCLNLIPTITFWLKCVCKRICWENDSVVNRRKQERKMIQISSAFSWHLNNCTQSCELALVSHLQRWLPNEHHFVVFTLSCSPYPLNLGWPCASLLTNRLWWKWHSADSVARLQKASHPPVGLLRTHAVEKTSQDGKILTTVRPQCCAESQASCMETERKMSSQSPATPGVYL